MKLRGNPTLVAVVVGTAVLVGAAAATYGLLSLGQPSPDDGRFVETSGVDGGTSTALASDDAAFEDSLVGELDVEVDLRRLVKVFPWKDMIAPIYEPEFVAGRLADLEPDEMVMAVEINGESRAYPVGILAFREMVNDVVGGVPILVSWCPRCYTGLVHDRRVGGDTLVFGNQGALFMQAMTWWDHGTESIWSQPWGMAIDGELKGTRLKIIPTSLVPWNTWLAGHPDTLVLETDKVPFKYAQEFKEDFVIGINLGEHAKAYPFELASGEAVINDRVGPFPVVVLVDRETKGIDVYLRRVGELELEFAFEGGLLVDLQTGSTWDRGNGFSVDGPFEGESLREVPFASSFDWAWKGFYPHSEFYGTEAGNTVGR